MRASGAQGSRAFRKSARPARGHWRRAGGAGPDCAQLLRQRPRLTRQVQRPPDGRGHDLLNPAPGARECSWTHAHEDVQIGRKASGHEPSQPNCWSQTPSIVDSRGSSVRSLSSASFNQHHLSVSQLSGAESGSGCRSKPTLAGTDRLRLSGCGELRASHADPQSGIWQTGTAP